MDPADIGKHPDLIKKAQADISQCDVLVCGRCHSVFHLIDLFREHKENEPDCKRSSGSTLHNCDEAQAKVWAFLLWKSAQRQSAGEEKNAGANNSWKLYQTWVKLEESVRDTWIVAGKTIQSFSKTGAGNLQEMPVKITKTILEPQNEAQDKANAQNRFTPAVRKVGDVKPPTTLAGDAKNRIVVGAQTGVVKKTDGTPVKTPITGSGAASAAGATTTTTGTPVRRSFATRTHPKTGACSEEEVEKILAKRFSPIIKMHEYLVKWVKMTNDQNTWEPLTHLHSCQSILEHFEVQLAKQKEQRAATAARALQMQRQEKGATGAATTTGTAGSGTTTTTTTTAGSGAASIANQLRPVRTSKASALDRVKQWTAGNRSPGDSADDATGPAGKRKLDEAESDGPNDADGVDTAKKLKTESSSAVSDALTKVSQTGNVKIVSVSGAGGGAPTSGIMKSAVNGTVATTVKDGTSAEVVIIKSPKDGIASGISKKSPGQQLVVGGGSAGAITTRLSPRSGGEAAKVKIVSKSEMSGGGGGGVHGIFKVKPEPTGSSPQSSSPKAVLTTATAGSTTPHHPPSRPITITTGASTTDSSGVTTRIIRRNIDGTEQLVKQTIRKTPKLVPFSPGQQQQRPGGIGTPKPAGVYTSAPVPKITTSAAASGQQRATASPRVISTSQQKPIGSRVVTSVSGGPGTVVRTSTVTRTVGGPASSEQKINALRRQGVNVVKRVITSSTVAGGKKAGGNEEEETEAMTDGFSSNISIPPPPSPPRAMTLCPVTGKVLAQAEGEPTPVPSPEAEPEEKKVDVKQESGSANANPSEQPAAEGGEQQMVVATGGDQTDTQVQQLLTNEDGSPILVAGEDGTVYQVAGKNAEGQTILIAQGSDGEQSCVLVASQEGEEEAAGGAGGVLTLDAAVSEAVAVPQEGQEMTEEQAAQYQQSVDTNQELTISTEDSQDTQITAEVVQADQPSPGGTRRVVLLLPDGSFMMTEVNDEQYQSLNLVN
ncbi:mucin-19 isoform X1 [Anopheles stephensi]|uniref:mucin-19 isoform X1 n=1 Tax=Anopheles stephensi TaxID=30069 RepID=UPI00165896C3|nr:mucin-19 isoform X1 [Anopheles stephensi]XP_035893532.1 mucin-19 isoform X1 [Anopheles stephensi]